MFSPDDSSLPAILCQDDTTRQSPHYRLRGRSVLMIAPIVLAGLFLSGWAAAEPPALSRQELAARTAQTIRQLSSRQLEVRQAAEKSLVELGPEVLPLLPAPDLLGESSSREALRRVRKQLELALTRQAAEPSRLTLQGSFTSSQLAADITRQTGNSVTFVRDAADAPEPPLAVDWQARTFWEALRELQSISPYRIDSAQTGTALVLRQKSAEAPEPLASLIPSGPMAWDVVSIDQKPLEGSTNTLLRFHLFLRTEPRLDPLFVFLDAADWQVNARLKSTTENPKVESAPLQPLALWNPAARYELVAGRSHEGTTFTIDAILPAGMLASEYQLVGKARVHLGLVRQEFEFPLADLKPGKSLRRGGVTITIRSLSALGASPATIGLSAAYDVGGPAFESHRAWVFHRQAWLKQGPTSPLEPFHDLTVTQATSGVTAAEFEFTSPFAKDDTFVYSAPLLLTDLAATLNITIPAPAASSK